ncbi:MAG: hypothetical protein DCC47_11825, partial [Acidobacteria bacterium]
MPQTNLARPGQAPSSTGRPAVPTPSETPGDKSAARPGADPAGSAQQGGQKPGGQKPGGQQPGPTKQPAARSGGNPAGNRPSAATPPTRPVVTGTAAAS